MGEMCQNPTAAPTLGLYLNASCIPFLQVFYGLNVCALKILILNPKPSVMVSGVRALGGDEVLGWSHRDG